MTETRIFYMQASINIQESVAKELVQTLNKLFAQHVKGSKGWEDRQQYQWIPGDIFQRLLQTAFEESSLESICSTMAGCSADTVLLRLQDVDYVQTVNQLNSMLKTIFLGFKLPKQVRLTVSIDITDYPYYGERTLELCVGSKTKAGTTYFNRYFTACVHLGNYYVPLYIRPILQVDGVKPGNLIKAFLKEVYSWCPFFRLLADAYFSALPVLKLLKKHHLEFILNMRHIPQIREAIATIKETQFLIVKSYGINSTSIRATYRCLKKKRLLTIRTKIYLKNNSSTIIPLTIQTMLLKRKDRQGKKYFRLEYYVYMTNIATSGEYILKIYKSRWRIETEYHVVQIFQGRTSSRLLILRILLKGLGFLLTALWVRINVDLKQVGFTKRELSHQLKSLKPYRRIFTANILLSSPVLKVLAVYRNSVLLLTTEQLCRIVQSLWR